MGGRAGNRDSLEWLSGEQKTVNQFLREYLDREFKRKDNTNQDLHDALFKHLREFLLRGGKRIRPVIMRQCYRVVAGKGELGEACLIPEFLHAGTLIIDDIEDGSTLRRGKPALHTQIGVDSAINAGNYLYFCHLPLLQALRTEQRQATLSLIIEEMEQLHRGQALDIYWHRGTTTKRMPSAADYLEMCRLKTGTMMRLSARLGALLGGGSKKQMESLGSYAEKLGVAFQIRDDILNVRPTEQWGKEYGEDITEGKRTLLAIHAAETATRRDRALLLNILNKHTTKRSEIEKAIALLEKYRSFEHAESVAFALVKQGLDTLRESLPDNQARRNLEQLGGFFLTRLS